jgi:hypothetical protein
MRGGAAAPSRPASRWQLPRLEHARVIQIAPAVVSVVEAQKKLARSFKTRRSFVNVPVHHLTKGRGNYIEKPGRAGEEIDRPTAQFANTMTVSGPERGQ